MCDCPGLLRGYCCDYNERRRAKCNKYLISALHSKEADLLCYIILSSGPVCLDNLLGAESNTFITSAYANNSHVSLEAA